MIEIILQALILVALIAQIILLIVLLRKKRNSGAQEQVLQKFIDYENRLDKNEISVRDEIGKNREELTRAFVSFTGMLDGKLRAVQEAVDTSAKVNREELTASLKSFEEKFSANVKDFNELQRNKFNELMVKQDALTKDTNAVFEKNRETIEKKLSDIQTDNSAKLEKMRETVDEKLHKTLETRLGESFKLVSERLELVQKGLGEMQNLATGVGDLKKVLSNVKTKGVLGEYQLGGILEQILTPSQYAQNVKTREGSADNVEYAVKIPSKEDSAKNIWLPIDAKFPTEDYERLNDAYDAGNTEDIVTLQKRTGKKDKTLCKRHQNKIR